MFQKLDQSIIQTLVGEKILHERGSHVPSHGNMESDNHRLDESKNCNRFVRNTEYFQRMVYIRFCVISDNISDLEPLIPNQLFIRTFLPSYCLRIFKE